MSDQENEPDLAASGVLSQGGDRRQGGERRQSGFASKVFQADDVLLREGEPGEEAYLIRRGKVEVRKGGLSDNPKVVATLGKGSVVGEMSLIDDQPHVASVVAVEETEVNVIARDEFQRRFDGMDSIMKGVLTILVERLRRVADDSRKQENMNWADWKKK